MMSFRSLYRTLALGWLPGHGLADMLNGVVSIAGVTVIRDVKYGPAWRNRLDIYVPEAASVSPCPVVVFFYGGGWTSGAKADYHFAGASLAQNGIVTVVADYRLYPEVIYPRFLEDGAAAVAWTSRTIAEYGGDPNRMVLMGHSAGAYIAAMLTLDPVWLANQDVSRDWLRGTIGLAGPYDFLPMADEEVTRIFFSPDVAATQPITHADGRAPPLLLLSGSSDETVDPANSVRLAERQRASGGSAELVLYPGTGHIGVVLALTPMFSSHAPVLTDVLDFVRHHARANRD